MKILVTGASGYIGNGVAKALARTGFSVFGLVRSQAAALALQEQEITPLVSTLPDLPKGVKGFDVIVHCAFEQGDKEMQNLEALLSLSPRQFIYTSGVWVYGNQTKEVDETTPLSPLPSTRWRPRVEEKALQSASVVIRPGCVYGYRQSLIGMFFEGALEGEIQVVGEGENHWALVHLDDLSHLYVLAVERRLSKEILNATEPSPPKIQEIVGAIGKLTGAKVKYIPYEKGLEQFGPLAEGLAVDQPRVSSEKARRLLGWKPQHAPFLSRLETYWLTWKVSRGEQV